LTASNPISQSENKRVIQDGCDGYENQVSAVVGCEHHSCGRTATLFPGKGTPLSLNNVLNRQILPALNVCIHWGKSQGEAHKKELHPFERDPSRPSWHGWHAFRRGLGTSLHALGVDDLTTQRILRHSNVSVTQSCYIKTSDEQSIAAMMRLEPLCANRAPAPTPAPLAMVN
jgi:hypothetical protein